MGIKMNVQAIKDFKEKLYPKGPLEAKIIGATVKEAGTGREFFALELEILETIPANQTIDEDEFVNPLGKHMFTNVMTPMEGDAPGTVSMFEKQLSDMLKYGNIVPRSDDEVEADDLLNQFIGVVVGHKKINKDDPKSDLKAEITGFCAMPD